MVQFITVLSYVLIIDKNYKLNNDFIIGSYENASK